MLIIRWMIKTADRIGMIQDVVKIFSFEEVSIDFMEVSPGQISVKFRLDGDSSRKEILKSKLLYHSDIVEVVDVPLLPYEQGEKELQTILESASDGIIGMDAQGIVRYMNTVAAQLFDVESQKAAGRTILQLADANNQLLNLLKGQDFDHQPMSADTSKGTIHYVCSGRSVRGENNQITGAVVTLKSMKAAQNFVHSITKSQTFGFSDIICATPEMKRIIGIAQRVASSNYAVLIRGESGTGKELFARAMHEASLRSSKPFVPINCAALPESLLESELFGYEEGAFSGAKKGGKIGLFEAAHGGTLFLDEIGELSLILQGKLLRAIQERTIRRVGSNRHIPVNVRIIAATNRDLEEMVELKQFRQDLYYRINVIPINIPPLRERPEDVALLLEHFHQKYCAELEKRLEFSQAAYHLLINYEWPGNVRELQNVILRAIHLTVSGEIEIANLLIPGQTPSEKNNSLIRDKTSIKDTINYTEKEMIKRALQKHGSARGAAREVGLSHTNVLNKIRRYHLEHPLSTTRKGNALKNDDYDTH